MVSLYWELRQTGEQYRYDRLDTRILLRVPGTANVNLLPVVEWFLATHQ